MFRGSEAGETNSSQHAPWCEISDAHFISVEHPGIVRSVDNAVLSLGGDAKLGMFLNTHSNKKSLGLALRPNDPFRRPIHSKCVTTSNVALRITVPKRTGRKRKRGTAEPYVDTGHIDGIHLQKSQNVKFMSRSLADNPQSCKIEALGTIEQSHRFRALPDFQYSISDIPLAQNLRNSIIGSDYEDIKNFKMDIETKGTQQRMDMVPPPIFSQTVVPFNYAYHQNPSVKFSLDDAGKQISVNTSAMPKILTQLVSHDVDTVPTGPLSEYVPEASLEPRSRDLIQQVRRILQERPIMTRRVLNNRMPRDTHYDLKYVVQYAGYMFKSGPWRDAIIAFGLDPRADPKWRVYQTLLFKIVIKEESRAALDGKSRWNRSLRAPEISNQSHLFDGKTLIPDGKIWQACDITDPMLRQILDSDTLRSQCELQQDGWHNNGAWAKIRVIMRDKISIIMADAMPRDADYDRVCSIPNLLDDSNFHLASANKTAGNVKEQQLFTQVRQLARSLEMQAKRYSNLEPTKTNDDAAQEEEEQIDEENFDDGDGVALDDASVEGDDDDEAI